MTKAGPATLPSLCNALQNSPDWIHMPQQHICRSNTNHLPYSKQQKVSAGRLCSPACRLSTPSVDTLTQAHCGFRNITVDWVDQPHDLQRTQALPQQEYSTNTITSTHKQVPHGKCPTPPGSVSMQCTSMVSHTVKRIMPCPLARHCSMLRSLLLTGVLMQQDNSHPYNWVCLQGGS